MTDKALISELTWRSLEMQREAFPDMNHFVGPGDIPELLRQSQRKDKLNIHVISFGVIAKTEKELKEFAALCRKRKANVISEEDSFIWKHEDPIVILIGVWRSARVAGAAKIGAKISADNKKKKAVEGIAKIAKRWPLPSKEWSTATLLEEAGVSFNTAKAHLGKRPIAQYNYQAFLKRKLRKLQNAKT